MTTDKASTAAPDLAFIPTATWMVDLTVVVVVVVVEVVVIVVAEEKEENLSVTSSLLTERQTLLAKNMYFICQDYFN
ncbi:hypothetical protein ElyMa_003664300 [Elysia marginata]|uniref:Uncharacterized protein n=1 Tax=Elysia marginata TaxID=1093978 RepID=A0AAV4EY32_9GAST|nr:hypothetical protein ElyMa_003664300 [Elysia marginata]